MQQIIGMLPQVLSGIGDTVTAVVSTVSSIINTVTSVISTITSVFSTVASIIGTVTSAIGSVVGVITSVIGSVVSTVTSVIGTITQAISSVISFFVGIVKTVAGIVGAVVKTFVEALQASVEALHKFSGDVATMSDQTGMGFELAGNLATSLRAQGISSGTSAKIFGDQNMSPQLFNDRALVASAPQLQDPDFMVKMNKWYQNKSATEGERAARNQATNLFGGQLNPEMLRFLKTDTKTVEREANYNKELQGSGLALNGDQLENFNEQWTALMGRISNFAETVKAKFANEMLPFIQAVLDGASTLFMNNAGTISNALSSFAKWMYVDAPDILLNGADTVIGVVESVANVLFDFADAVANMISNEGPLDVIAATIDYISVAINGLANLFNFVGAIFQDLISLTQVQATMLANVIIAMAKAIASAIRPFTALLSAVIPSDTLKQVDAFVEGVSNWTFEKPQFQSKTLDAIQNPITGGTTDAVGALQNLRNSGAGEDLKKKTDEARKGFGNFTDKLHGHVQTVRNMAGTKDEREKSFNEHTKAVNNNTEVMKQGHDKIYNQLQTSNRLLSSDVAAKLLQYSAEDEFRLATR